MTLSIATRRRPRRLKRKRTARLLSWPSQSTQGKPSAIFGPREVWTDQSGLYRVELFREGAGDYVPIAIGQVIDDDLENLKWTSDQPIGRTRSLWSLKAAKKLCEEHARRQL